MTLQTVPYALQNASHSAALFRQSATAPWVSGGPLLPGELAVTQQATPNMTVQLGPGRAKVPGTLIAPPSGLLFTTQGMYDVLNDAAITLTVTASSTTHPRIDAVYIQVQDSFYSGSVDTVTAGIVTGTPAASPTVPTIPDNAILIRTIAVAANASSIVNANIGGGGIYAGTAGGVMQVETLAALETITGSPNQRALVTSDSTGSANGSYIWASGAWVLWDSTSLIVFTPVFANGISGGDAGSSQGGYFVRAGVLHGYAEVAFAGTTDFALPAQVLMKRPINSVGSLYTVQGSGMFVSAEGYIPWVIGEHFEDSTYLNCIAVSTPPEPGNGNALQLAFSYPVV